MYGWDKYEGIVAAEEQKQSKSAKCPFNNDEAIETRDYSECDVVIKKKKRAQRLVSYSDSSSSFFEKKLKQEIKLVYRDLYLTLVLHTISTGHNFLQSNNENFEILYTI